ncbi:hypothetical protein LTR22_019060 [Elasticomyces elasticus]|nr:hypothetical protein LTR22_019060 [Elasticomyces elasticus]KAK4911940.1 hypothetical protein LTR49_019587 [Elasticomyces elasticus]KAK5713651.1 hypothetical protein LTR15_011351 [Elasticomyces elasticus]
MATNAIKKDYDVPAKSDSNPSISDLDASVDGNVEDRFAGIDRKRLLRKVDLRILPYLCLCYMVVRLDLNNINNAGTMNNEVGHSLKKVLHLGAQKWAWVVAAFYYPYMGVEPVATLFVRKVGARAWLSRIMVMWSIVMTCMAAVNSYGSLITCRVLLGLLEGSFFTAMILHLSFWYTPNEMGSRVIYLYVANSSSGGFSGLFAYAVSFTDGKLYGWQWLFIIEGLLTFFLGIGLYFLLPNWPSTSKWLTPLEAEYVDHHIHWNAPKKDGKTWDSKEIKRMFADPTMWLFSAFWAFWSVSVWGASTMQTFLLLDLNLTGSATTQLLQIPPAATGVVMLLISAYLIRGRNISPFLCVLLLIPGVMISFIVLFTVTSSGLRLACLCVITGAAPTAYACLWPMRTAALRGTSSAALGIGINNAISQFSGIIGPQLWRTDFGPRYDLSAQVSTGLAAGAFCVTAALWYLMAADLTWSPFLSRRVLAQTQIRQEDLEAKKQGATIATDLV